MNNCSVVSVGGPDAAINAMNREAVQRHLMGVNSDDPVVILANLEEMVQPESGDQSGYSEDFSVIKHRLAIAHYNAVTHPFFYYQRLRCIEEVNANYARSELLAIVPKRGSMRVQSEKGKHQQFYGNIRIH